MSPIWPTDEVVPMVSPPSIIRDAIFLPSCHAPPPPAPTKHARKRKKKKKTPKTNAWYLISQMIVHQTAPTPSPSPFSSLVQDSRQAGSLPVLALLCPLSFLDRSSERPTPPELVVLTSSHSPIPSSTSLPNLGGLVGGLPAGGVLEEGDVDGGGGQVDVADDAAADEDVLDGAEVRVLDLLLDRDVVELDVEVLVDRLEGARDLDVVLELDGDGLVDQGLEEAVFGVSRGGEKEEGGRRKKGR